MQKAMILVLEDSPERIAAFKEHLGDNVTFVDSAFSAIHALSRCDYDLVFLDYDLGNHKSSGAVTAHWLSEHNYASRIIIHSMNPVGAHRMQRIIPGAEIKPFHQLFK